MTERNYRSSLLQQADRDENGELVFEKEIDMSSGGTTKREVNASKLFQPGIRKTSKLYVLEYEAERANNGEEIENPAFPIDEETADKLQEKLPDNWQPAYRLCTPGEFP